MQADATATEVAVIGGGVVGSAVAYFLAADGCAVTVIEKDPSYARASTGRSAGGVRQQFSLPENIAMSRFGAEFMRAAPALLAVDGEPAAVTFTEGGYLFLADGASEPVLRRNVAIQRQAGADVAILDPAALAARFAWLAVDDLACGSLGLSGEGWVDPHSLHQALRRRAQACGARFVADEAVGFDLAPGGIAAVRLARGGRLAARFAVNAAGPAAGAVARLAGVDLPVGPRPRSVFVVHCRTAIGPCPLTIDRSGVWFRPEGAGYICGVSPPEEADPESWDLEVDHALFEDIVWPALARRVPAFQALKLTGSWAGHYDYNAFDQNAVLGPHPALENFLFATGFSGHGLQQAPAAGRAIAELIRHGAYRTLDLGTLGFGRIAAGRRRLETNIV